ncbi:MAG: hypothetical protein AB9836_06080 [Aminipila sp.]
MEDKPSCGMCNVTGEEVTEDTKCSWGWIKGQPCCCNDDCEEFREHD